MLRGSVGACWTCVHHAAPKVLRTLLLNENKQALASAHEGEAEGDGGQTQENLLSTTATKGIFSTAASLILSSHSQ